MARILVAGASGKVGQATINELRQRGYHVRALLRNKLETYLKQLTASG